MRALAPTSEFARLVIVVAVAASLIAIGACAPKCPKVKATLDEVQITSEDVARINRLVDKRKAAIAEASAGGHDTFSLEKMQFSVTGYKLAVETQLRIATCSAKVDISPLYAEYRSVFDALRCDFDALVVDPERHRLSSADGAMIQRWVQRVGAILRKEGQLSNSELKGYLEEGIRDSGEEE